MSGENVEYIVPSNKGGALLGGAFPFACVGGGVGGGPSSKSGSYEASDFASSSSSSCCTLGSFFCSVVTGGLIVFSGRIDIEDS